MRYWHRVLPVLLAALALLPFLAGIHGPFLHDDWGNLPLVKVGPFSWGAVLDVATRNSSGLLHRPLSNLSFAANYWTTGFDPFAFKLTNLAIHGACGLLVYVLGLRLLALLRVGANPAQQRFAALAAMLLWLVHPLQVSTALYVVQRMAQLSTLFMLLGLWLLARWLGQEQRSWRGAIVCAAGMALCGLLGLACKENAALLPLMAGVVLLAWRWRRREPGVPLDPPTRAFIAVVVVLPLLLAVVVMAVKPGHFIDGYAIRQFTLMQRLLTEPAVLWFYLRLFLLPWIPAMGLYHDDFPLLHAGSPLAWLAIAAWIAVIALAWRKRRQWPLFALAVLWFLAGHALESSVFPLELVYEHRNYLPLVGPCLWLGSLASALAARVPAFGRVGWLLPVLALAGATAHRASSWSSDDLFTETEYLHHPDSFRALLGAAARAASIGDEARAQTLTRRIQELNPDLIWPLMLDVSMQCVRPYNANWSLIHQRLHANRDSDRFADFTRDTTERYLSGQCPHLDTARFKTLLEDGYQVALQRNDTNSEELFAKYRGWVAKTDNDPETMRLWWRRAIDADPQGVESLFDLAYEDLNDGRLEETASSIRELRARTAKYDLHVGYRIDELDGYLRDAEQKRGH